MINLTILSGDANEYFTQLDGKAGINIIAALENNQEIDDDIFTKTTVILANPDLLAPVVYRFTHLKWVQSTWAGAKPLIDVMPRSIPLTGIKGVFGVQMREYVFAYLLHFSRQIDKMTSLQKEKNWLQPTCSTLAGQTIGIMGTGAIGIEVAKMAKAFGMKVRGFATTQKPSPFLDEQYTLKEKLAFCEGLDALVCLLPHTAHTENIIDAECMSALPEHAVFINAGRGQCVDISALESALTAHKLRAAVLDVFVDEPLPQNSLLWTLPNAHITQHTAAVSRPKDIVDIFLENHERFCQNTALNYQIDLTKGY
ncbi:D-2-hydroxyacid dehydrogenase [Aestuariibacter sp. AA17]|uniref:D-2-hydroxyacid dehydrogenase n=1 Tax=Fluctibacter corallii TaxID=2984329 RepID=A0ABT3A506_9ALTE|nr:D-2-hydroxyacid dehydrogenase [Aestuariibacter sp. AA17]MCV2883715.1 D-2-hydroxyacid dehydrogenase [Aestuariibacter sp. AA17]